MAGDLNKVSPWFVPVMVFFVTLHYPSNVDPGLKTVDVPDFLLNDTYDIIIIGAGSAGSVVGSRLSEEPSWRVLVLEAGGDESIISETTFFCLKFFNTQFDWNYTTTQQKRACRAWNGVCEYPRGHALGGSSAINGAIYVRGNKADYDEWRDMGNTGWGYEEVLPYFLKSEDMQEAGLASTAYHSTGGYLPVKYPNYWTPLAQAYLDAAKHLGYKQRDINGEHQAGIDRIQLNQKDQSRCSAAKAFLRPARNRTNLHVVQGALVTKLVIDSGRVTSVVFRRGDKVLEVKTGKEVVLSAGAINTPQLLMLSGVGPADHLATLSIPTVLDLSVGKNLRDHIGVVLPFRVNNSVTVTRAKYESIESALAYSRDAAGPLSAGPLAAEAIGFLPLDPAEDEKVDFVTHCFSHFPNKNDEEVFYFFNGPAKTESAGSVTLPSGNIFDKPLIDVNFLSEEIDVNRTLSACQLAFKMVKTPALAKYGPTFLMELYPECSAHSPAEVENLCGCLMTQYGQTIFHPVGTAKMGPKEDPTSVVGANLMVHRMMNLRVVDASVMPTIPSGNTNAPTIMIAEKASDIIKQHWHTRTP